MDLTQACATMRREETAQLVSSARVGGLKSAFFQAAQQATFPFNLTGVKHDHAESTCLRAIRCAGSICASGWRFDLKGDRTLRAYAWRQRNLPA